MKSTISERISISLLCMIAVAGSVLLCAAGLVMADDNVASQGCLVIAHRGFSRVAPENTIAAAKKAIEVGIYGSEFDVKQTKDHVPVVIHDGTVDRTTNGTGRVSELSLAEIRALDAGSWKDPQFAGERVPTLDEMLATFKGVKCRPVIEVKGTEITDRVVASIRALNMVEQAVLISSKKETLLAARALEPRLQCGLVMGDKQMPKEGSDDEKVAAIVAQARECDVRLVDMDYRVVTAGVVAKLREERLTAWVWTVDEPEAMDNLIAWGIESITTNAPDVLLDRVKEAEKRNKLR